MNEIIINKMEGQYNIIRPLSTSTDLSFYVVNVIDNYIGLSFGIKPHNKMIGQYDVFARPRVTKDLPPIRDAFIKEDVPVFNYGKREQLRVGIDKEGNRHRSLLLFDTNKIEKDLHILKAVLKLQIASPHFSLDEFEVSTLNNKFDEYGVTWANQPTRDKFISIVELHSNQYEVKIDITDTFMSWYKNKRDNNGIVLKEAEQISNREIAFFSRESGETTPVIEVEYFDPTFRIPLHKELDILFRLQTKEKAILPIKFEVESFYKKDEIPIDLFVLSVIGELCVDFTISQTVILLDFIIAQISDLSLDFKFVYGKIDDLEINFYIPKNNLPIDMNVAGTSIIWLYFDVDFPAIPIDYAVTKDSIAIDFYIAYINDIDLRFGYSKQSIPLTFDRPMWVNFNVTKSFVLLDYEIPMNVVFWITKNYLPIYFVNTITNDISIDFIVAKPELDICFYVISQADTEISFSVSKKSIYIEFDCVLVDDIPILIFVKKYIHRPEDDLLVDVGYSHPSVLLDFRVSQYSDIHLKYTIRAIKDLSVKFRTVHASSSNIGIDFVVNAVNDIILDVDIASKFLDLRYEVFKHKTSTRRIDFLVEAINDIDLDLIVSQKSDVYLKFYVQKHLFSDIIISLIKEGEIKQRKAYVFIM